MASPTPAPAASNGSLRLGRLLRTDVFVHWSWFVAAVYLIQDRQGQYSSMAWNVAEYLIGFLLVTLHEFGHVLACRQVGGAADRVVLWPLGGLAFVAPPNRPGAHLWTTAAGPLVNLVLVPVMIVLSRVAHRAVGIDDPLPDWVRLIEAVRAFNTVMLVFNLLPIFPLDGGRIVHALLWFVVGYAWGLTIAAGLGVVGGAAIALLAFASGQAYLGVMAGFLVLSALGGLGHARRIDRMAKAARRADRACPHCKAAAPAGQHWRCNRCAYWYDLHDPATLCPKGGDHVAAVACLSCNRQFPLAAWIDPRPAAQAEPPLL